MDEGLRDIPNNREAEEALLGSIFIDPDAYFDVLPIIQSADRFYIHKHRWLWEAFARLVKRNEPIDILLVIEELDRFERLEEIGGAAYVTQLISNVPSSLNAVSYAKVIADLAMRRRMLEAANKLATLAYNETIPANDVLARGHEELHSVGGDSGRLLDGKQLADAVDANLKKHAEMDELPGIKTGISDFDILLGGGYKPEWLYLIAGRPGMGKSGKIATNITASLKQNKYTLLFSLEMGGEQYARRLIAQTQTINTQDLAVAKLTDDEWVSVTHGVEWIYNQGSYLRIDDTPAISPEQMYAVCKNMKARNELDIVFVDYAQLMTGQGHDRVRQMGHVSRSLKQIARDLRVPVVAAAQLSREIEKRANKEPVLSDLKETGDWEQDADVVSFLWMQGERIMDAQFQHLTLSTKKHRDGPLGDVPVFMRTETTKFEGTIKDTNTCF